MGCSSPAQDELPTASAAPAAAPVDYVALGDSYASGYGAGSYVGECGRSPLGTPTLLGAEEGITLAADATCAGARAASEPGGPAAPPGQGADAVDAGRLSPDTGLVTVSAGGNDVGFGEVAGVCAAEAPPVCREVIATQNASALPVLESDLDTLYGTIRSAAPDATVVVTGYPHLFSPEFGQTLLPPESQEAFNAGTDDLNEVLRERADAHGFVFADLVEPFRGHGLGAPEPWITFQEGAPDNLHPTVEGYGSGYLPAILGSVDLDGSRR
ncbi:hypothetical protein AC792_15510 [Arthrobacter sp. RIT-PI-e]|nr:hypothetical protein AC792_15510 [Arthrobacter sp. RIT-PI-e]